MNQNIRNIIRYFRRHEIRMAMNMHWYSINKKKRGLIFWAGRMKKYYNRRYGIKIGDLSAGKGLYFPHPQNIIIGGNTCIGNSVTIYHNVTLGQSRNMGKYPVIKDYVLIYPGVVVAGGITIGEGAVIGANSFVNKDVPPYTIVAGVPAVKIGERPRPKDNDGKPDNSEYPYLDY